MNTVKTLTGCGMYIFQRVDTKTTKNPEAAVKTTAYGFLCHYSLWLQIRFIEIWGIKEIGNVDLKALAYFVDHAQLYRVIGAIDDITDGGFGHAALYIELILRHVSLAQKLFQAGTDRLV